MGQRYEVLCSQQEEPEWQRFRYEGISASLVPSLLGLSPWETRSRGQILRDQARRISIPSNAAMECGIRFESVVLDWYNDVYDAKAEPWQQLLRSTETPWMLATPDAKDGDDLLEVKCVHPAGAKRWDAEGVPEHVRAQVLAQLHITGCETAHVVMWSWGRRPARYTVHRDERLIRTIVSICEEAWLDICHLRATLEAEVVHV